MWQELCALIKSGKALGVRSFYKKYFLMDKTEKVSKPANSGKIFGLESRKKCS
jgi:hypothetical protein